MGQLYNAGFSEIRQKDYSSVTSRPDQFCERDNYLGMGPLNRRSFDVETFLNSPGCRDRLWSIDQPRLSSTGLSHGRRIVRDAPGEQRPRQARRLPSDRRGAIELCRNVGGRTLLRSTGVTSC
jgi:hypothetical protein